ncbi:pentapeptide repeat-containing protein [Arthrobacter sp. MDT1-65]
MVVSKKSVPLVPSADVSPPPLRHDRWWFRDVVIPILIAVIVGGMVIAGQYLIDDRRADREQAMADRQQAEADELARLEDMRFIREQSAGLEPLRYGEGEDNVLPPYLPFQGMDLHGMDLSFMDLRRANFTNADLTNVNFHQANLRGAIFRESTVVGVNFIEAELNEASFWRVAFIDSDLRGATTGGTMFTYTCRNAGTKWITSPDQQQQRDDRMCTTAEDEP